MYSCSNLHNLFACKALCALFAAMAKSKPSTKKDKEVTKKKAGDVKGADRTAMLGWLKYTHGDSMKASPELKVQCKQGLEVYEGLPPSKKGAFIERWKATKDSKNMSWVKDFEEEMSKEKDFTRTKVCGFYTRLHYMQVPLQCACASTCFYAHACMH